MRELTKIMIEKYALTKLKYDFMGYDFDYLNQLSFHHLILSKQICRSYGYGDGYYIWNGAILRKDTSHDYLHTIAKYDMERFVAITSELIDENVKGYLDSKNINYIDDILNSFEREYSGVRTNKGVLIVKEKYTRRRKNY